MRLEGSEIVVRTLMEQGCSVVFGFPGATVIDIYDALYEHAAEIRHVLVAHEQGAAHAADGYARATGRVGVCLATSGPGSTNLVTGIATAFMDSVPLVAITGNVPTDQIGTDSFQELDITGVTLPITKHNFFVEDVDELADTIREAFRLAQSGRPGPVLVDIPKDVQQKSGFFEPGGRVEADVPAIYDDSRLTAAAACVDACHRPVVYYGGGVVSARAERLVLELAEKADAPIVCSLMGLSAIPSDHPRFFGMEGMHGHYAATLAMKNADCVIALGCRFNDRATGNREKFGVGCHIVHVDVDGSEIRKNTDDDYGIVGDVRLVIPELVAALGQADHRGWWELLHKVRADAAKQADEREAWTPAAVLRLADAHRLKDEVVVTDVGQHQMWAAQNLTFCAPRTFVTSGGLGTMGFGLPAAVGVALATGKRTLLVVGDGGLGMSLHEMATAVAYGAPITILVMDNGVLGMVRQWQGLFYGERYAATTLEGVRQTDFVAAARAFGADGEAVADRKGLERALAAARASQGPYLIDCEIDKDELVLPMLAPGGSLDDIIVKVGD